MISDLVDEFRLNRDRLGSDIAINARAFAAAEAWLEALGSPVPLPQDSLDALMVASVIAPRFDPLSGVLTSLLATGDLPLLRHRGLRHALAGRPNLVEESRTTAIQSSERRLDLLPLLLEPPEPGDMSVPSLHRTYLAVARIGTRQQERLLPEMDRILILLEEAAT